MSVTITEDRRAGLSPLGFRRLPHNVDAEKGLLGAIFLDNRRAYEMVSDYLRPEHFALLEHGRIFEACAAFIERGQTANPTTLSPYFQQNQTLGDIGGPAYLMELANSAATIMNAGEYGRMIYDLHLRRELIALGEEVVNRAYEYELDESANHQIERAEQTLYDLATRGEQDAGFRPFKDSLVAALEMARSAHGRGGELVGVTTGLTDLDTHLGGLHSSDLIILAGRPAMGKTALATNIASNAAYAWHQSEGSKGAVVGFFSLEMSSEQLASRIVCEQTNIPSDRMRKGKLTNEEFTRVCAGMQELQKHPIYIDDTPALTITALRTRARRLQRKYGLGLIVVDYLQLISSAPGARHDNRVQELSAITRGLKTLAKELKVPVIALSQLSRAVEQREDKRPQLSDLRESGSIEQDADVVIFLYRDEYYRRGPDGDAGDPDFEKNVAEAIIAKHRHGATDTIKLRFIPEFTRFADREVRDDRFS
ncbi:MAG: replicative DNA helicase [Rhodospirillales bacterium]|nr:replicative DNA helicase [Rhodospirillales bacterium]